MWTTLFEYSLLRLENSISTGNSLLCTTFMMLLDSLRKMWKHFIYIKRCHGNKHLYMCVYSCFTSRFIFHGLTTSHIYLWIYIVDFCGLYVFLLFLNFIIFVVFNYCYFFQATVPVTVQLIRVLWWNNRWCNNRSWPGAHVRFFFLG